MPALSEYSNVYNTALNVLDKKGFSVWYNEETELFCAEKEGWDFMAESPCSLLGIIAIYEHKKPDRYHEYWWQDNDKALYPATSQHKPDYVSVVTER